MSTEGKKLRIGVIGAGSISGLHLEAYKQCSDTVIAAVCDLNEERAKAAAAKYGAEQVYTNYRELLADPSIDAVSICTWNNTHAEISIAALEAGKHVLCEKPMCKTVEEAEKVQEAVRRSGKILQVGFVRRYAGSVDVLKRFIDAGELGEIYYAKASCLRRLGNPGGWFSDSSRSGGGPLIDLGVHIIDLCWYLMGRPKVKSISGNTYRNLGNRANVQNLSFYKAADYDASRNDVEDAANAVIRFENGASLLVDVSFTLHAAKDELYIKLYGDKGGAEVEPALVVMSEKYDTIVNSTPQIDHTSFDASEAFGREIAHFAGSCLGRVETLSPVEDGLEVTRMLSAIYESAAKGTEIHFD
ncbi:Gfo/Idh/MocA family protein [Paenibacillus sacheonensis]|uniref:Gfo/Idh/MocA family oxidoreductase n=1 Tax=Paenibacillus sacheonensis TaxID=742054 RepID=A0A7X5C396_9BACL|nr:Gfo/Idh/MocA family oxidoreductase [Paenibacillus sacheonensis]MBM7568467.1 putative dehydrogenase [Paenibacillus sacheonensis]NBC72165.1 Gfo/Idh/MocA family oxidoreductase [Paenibacillus sacheonensis]